MFPALLGTPINLGLIVVAEIELLCNHFPVQVGELTYQINIGLLLLDDLSEQFAFKIIPAKGGEVVFLHGEPFEHAVACTHSRD